MFAVSIARLTTNHSFAFGQKPLAILERCETGEWELIISEMVETEVAQIADQEQRQRIEGALLMARSHIRVNETVESRGEELQNLSFQGFDTIHLACAEIAQVDVFLSTDDRLLRRAARHHNSLTVAVDNPAAWLISTLQAGDSDDDPNRTETTRTRSPQQKTGLYGDGAISSAV